jgi:hypothetical protein
MLKAKPDFKGASKLSLHVRRDQQAREAPIAMADYIKARQKLLERMVALRAARLKQLSGDN